MTQQLDSHHISTVRSCLGDTLQRLQNNMKASRRAQSHDEDQFQSWLDGWSVRSDQIEARLELIDLQLNNLGHRSPPAPHFSIVSAPEEQ